MTEDDNHVVPCTVCGDHVDLLNDDHYRLNEETRPVPDEPDSIDDFTSRNWIVCWICVHTKFGIDPE